MIKIISRDGKKGLIFMMMKRLYIKTIWKEFIKNIESEAKN